MRDMQSSQCTEFVMELVKLLATHRHYERVFHFVVDRLTRLYRSRACAIVLIDSESEYLSIENCSGISHTFCKSFRQQVATGSIGEMLWTGRPILISDASLLPEVAHSVELESPFASCLCVQVAVHHQTIGYLYADSEEKDAFVESDIPVFETFARIAALAYYQNRLYEDNLRLDRVDHETELQRYSFFSESLQQNLDRAASTGEPLGLIMMDIDNYKRISNTFGGGARRAFMREFGGLINRQLRTYDSACRYGADEVIMMLPNTSADAAIEAANAVCESIRNHTFTEHDLVTTVSCGVAVFPDDADTVEEIILSAKHSVFEAQRRGRNKIFH
ncbi:MAG: GGDEF domain-containing protein, partial [Bacteroidetes bacterium]|nr:GGDEF domain-containing protein [Bacteroidota bacterium]